MAVFLRRLEKAPPAGNLEQALKLVSETLNAVESELTDIPFNSAAWQTDGRMYPPEEDSARDVPGRDDVVRYRSKAHNIYIRANGALEIRDTQHRLCFAKKGADGNWVDL